MRVGLRFISYLLLTLGVMGVNAHAFERVAIDVELAPVTNVNVLPELDPVFHFSVPVKQHIQFQIQKYETTCEQYKEYRNELRATRPNLPQNEAEFECEFSENEPVSRISWGEARSFCRAQGGDLPSEIQWVAAALVAGEDPNPCFSAISQGKMGSVYEQLDENPESFNRCVFSGLDEELLDETDLDTISDQKIRVELTYPSVNGVYGMEGNVWEWVADAWNPKDDVQLKAIKGGAFTNGKDRVLGHPLLRNYMQAQDEDKVNVGFRCAWKDR